MVKPSLFLRLKERKIVQWAIAYLAAAWAFLEAAGFVAELFGWPEPIIQVATLVCLFGFFVVVTLAWYHGEKGRQRVSGPELLTIALLLLIAGGVVAIFRRPPAASPDSASVTEINEGGEVVDALNRLPGLAVLPFANRSGNPGDQYFTDGIHDELLTTLQRASGLRVISRTSSDAYRDTEKTIPGIGRELGVDYILEGGVQRGGERIRITVQLIDARSDTHLWAKTYDRVLRPDSLLDIQSEIVQTVYGETGAALLDREWRQTARRGTDDLEAFDLYARSRDLGGTDESIALLEQALEHDPGFVVGLAALSMAEGRRFHGGQRSEERRALARGTAERAVELDPDSPDAQMAMGLYFYWVEKDYQGALKWLVRAAGDLRGDYIYHLQRAYVERRMGRWNESVSSLRAALSLSPRDAGAWRELGSTYMSLRRYSEAEGALREADRLAPGDDSTRRFLVWLARARMEPWFPGKPSRSGVSLRKEAWERGP